MFWKGKEPDRAEVAKMLENFLRGTAGDWDWDDYIQGMEYSDSTLEGIRQRFVNLSNEFPPRIPNEYCGEEGLKVIESYIAELRKTI